MRATYAIANGHSYTSYIVQCNIACCGWPSRPVLHGLYARIRAFDWQWFRCAFTCLRCVFGASRCFQCRNRTLVFFIFFSEPLKKSGCPIGPPKMSFFEKVVARRQFLVAPGHRATANVEPCLKAGLLRCKSTVFFTAKASGSSSSPVKVSLPICQNVSNKISMKIIEIVSSFF